MIHGMRPSREAYFRRGQWVIRIQPPAMIGGEPVEVYLSAEQFERYKAWRDRGVLIQEALPDLDKVQREMIMTGLAPARQEQIFKSEEDEDE